MKGIGSREITKMLYGGDYNPEQWDEATWAEDMRLLRLAQVDVLTINVFSWASIQKDEDTYDFERLDRIMELVKENGFKVCMATSTGAHPAWMARKYPEILRTEFNGIRRKFGGRHNSCPNSSIYRHFAPLLASKLAERYAAYDNIVAWHISNEFGGQCYCDNCEKAFRIWLKKKYGTVDALNHAWNTAFWGHTFYDFEEVVVPDLRSEHFGWDKTMFQGISLDYARFNSDSMLDCYRLEYDALKKITPELPVTTNLMGFYKPLDYQKWAKYMDFVSWDNYPGPDEAPAVVAMKHDMMRGLKGGQPFILMEQTPSVTNWQEYNALKRPGVMRLISYQAVAHGSDAVMFFQMRRSVGACEKYHGAVIDHAGHENTRVFRECQALGKELGQLGGATLGSRTPAKTAIVVDWDNWWAVEYSAGPSRDMKYLDELAAYYEAFHRMNIPVDMVGTEDDLSGYSLVVSPLLYMVKDGFDEKLKKYAAEGGTYLASYFSGIVDEHDLVVTGGYPGVLRELLGIWVEEQDALTPQTKNHFVYGGKEYPAKIICDIMHPEGAEVLACYGEDFYQGTPALTCHAYGKGRAYYVGTRSSQSFYVKFLEDICKEAGISPLLQTPEGVEAAQRENGTKKYLFLLNHNQEAAQVSLQLSKKANGNLTELLTGQAYQNGADIMLAAKAVAILEYDMTDGGC